MKIKLTFNYNFSQEGKGVDHRIQINLTDEQTQYLAQCMADFQMENYDEEELQEILEEDENPNWDLGYDSGEILVHFDDNWAVGHGSKSGPILQAFADDSPIVAERVAGGKYTGLNDLFESDDCDITPVTLFSERLYSLMNSILRKQ